VITADREGVTLSMDNVQTITQDAERATPPDDIFVSLRTQLDNVRKWNEERGWGFGPDDLDAIDLTPAAEDKPLVVDLIAVYLDGDANLNGVRRTCHELWTVAAAQQSLTWSWDWYWDKWLNRPQPVRLFDGVVHRTVHLSQHGPQPRLGARRGARRRSSLPAMGPGHGRSNCALHLALRL